MKKLQYTGKLNKKLLTEERGSVAVLVALSMVVLLGISALVVDVGLAYVERVKLNNAVDAAALAGGLELVNNESDSQVKEEAVKYAALNDAVITQEDVDINISRTRIAVDAVKSFELFFARVLGFEQMETSARAAVVVGYPKKMTRIKNGNLFPFVLPQDVYDSAKEGKEIRLMGGNEDHFLEIDGEPVPGNWGAIRLGGSGSDEQNFYEAIKGDLNMAFELEIMEVGDEEADPYWYDDGTKPGNKPKADEAVAERLKRSENEGDIKPYGLIPVVDKVEKGGQTEIRITGFAVFEPTGTERNNPGHDIIGYVRNDKTINDFVGEITEDQGKNFGAVVYRIVE